MTYEHNHYRIYIIILFTIRLFDIAKIKMKRDRKSGSGTACIWRLLWWVTGITERAPVAKIVFYIHERTYHPFHFKCVTVWIRLEYIDCILQPNDSSMQLFKHCVCVCLCVYSAFTIFVLSDRIVKPKVDNGGNYSRCFHCSSLTTAFISFRIVLFME